MDNLSQKLTGLEMNAAAAAVPAPPLRSSGSSWCDVEDLSESSEDDGPPYELSTMRSQASCPTHARYPLGSHRQISNSAASADSRVLLQQSAAPSTSPLGPPLRRWFRLFNLHAPSVDHMVRKIPLIPSELTVQTLSLNAAGSLLAVGSSGMPSGAPAGPAAGERYYLMVYRMQEIGHDGPQVLWQTRLEAGPLQTIVWSPGSQRLATFTERLSDSTLGWLRLWDTSCLTAGAGSLLSTSFRAPASLSFSPTTGHLLAQGGEADDRELAIFDHAGRQLPYPMADGWRREGESLWAAPQRLVTLVGDADGGTPRLALREVAADAPAPVVQETFLPEGIKSPVTLAVSADHCRAAVVGSVELGRAAVLAWVDLAAGRAAPMFLCRDQVKLGHTGSSVGPQPPVLAWAAEGVNGHRLAAIVGGGATVAVVDTESRFMREVTTVFGPSIALSWSPCSTFLLVSGANAAAAEGTHGGGARPALRLEIYQLYLPRPGSYGRRQPSFTVKRKVDFRSEDCYDDDLASSPTKACPAFGSRDADGHFKAVWLLSDCAWLFNYTPIGLNLFANHPVAKSP